MGGRFLLFDIAKKNVKSRPYRSGIMALFVFVLSASLFASTLLLTNMNRGLESTSRRLGADLAVVPSGYFSSIENALFTGKPCTVYFEKEWEQRLEAVEGVESASSQLFLATLNAECCEAESQLIAFDAEKDFVILPWLSRETDQALTERDVAVGCGIGLEKGDTVTYYGVEFTVAAVLDKSGMGYDHSAFINFDGAKRIIESESAGNFLMVQNDDFISMVNLKVREGYDAEAVSRSIGQEYGDIAVYTSSKLLGNVEKSVRGFGVYSRILGVALILLSTIAVMSIFSITANERKREFGIYLLFGTSKKQLARMILLEAGLIILSGTAAGIGVSGGCIYLFRNLIALRLELPYLEAGFGQVLPIILRCAGITAAAGVIAVIHSVVKVTGSTGAQLLEEGE